MKPTRIFILLISLSSLLSIGATNSVGNPYLGNIPNITNKADIPNRLNSQIQISNSSGNQSCHLCNDIVHIIQVEIHIANTSIIIIEDIVRTFCHTLPFPAQKKECFTLLDNLSEIIKWLMDGLSPHDICVKLGFCKK